MLANKPIMGWNTWNTFGTDINEDLIIETVNAFIEKGFDKAGYEYIIIDDGWCLKKRDKNGNLVADPKKFPHGIKYLADYIHSHNLKFGMYSAAGVLTCAGYPGSFGHEYQDAKTFADFEIDYLKYDTCTYPGCADPKNSYLTMSMALRSTGRDIAFAVCTVGRWDPWSWSRAIGGHTYRSSADITDSFISFKNNAISQITNKAINYSGSGCFNDLDMLTVGMFNNGHVAGLGGCTETEYETEFMLWCLFGSPLIIGCDIRKIDGKLLELLLNRDLIEINQDDETRPPYYEDKMVYANTETMSFLKILSKGKFAIGFFNFTDSTCNVSQLLPDIGVPSTSCKVLEMIDTITKEKTVFSQDCISLELSSHQGKIFIGRLIDAEV